MILHLNGFADGHRHEAVAPLEGELVHLAIEFAHSDGLWVEHVGADRLIERVLQSGLVQVLASVRQCLRSTTQSRAISRDAQAKVACVNKLPATL